MTPSEVRKMLYLVEGQADPPRWLVEIWCAQPDSLALRSLQRVVQKLSPPKIEKTIGPNNEKQ